MSSLSNISSRIRSDCKQRGIPVGEQLLTIEPTRYTLDDPSRCAPACEANRSPADALRLTIQTLDVVLPNIRANVDKLREGKPAVISTGMSIVSTPVGDELRSMAVFSLLSDNEDAMVFAAYYHQILAELAELEAGRLEFVAAGSAVFDVGFAPAQLHYGENVIGLGDPNQFLSQMSFFLEEGFSAGMGRWFRRLGSPVLIACQRIDSDPSDLDGALEMAQNIQDDGWRRATENWIRRVNKART